MKLFRWIADKFNAAFPTGDADRLMMTRELYELDLLDSDFLEPVYFNIGNKMIASMQCCIALSDEEWDAFIAMQAGRQPTEAAIKALALHDEIRRGVRIHER